MDRTRTRAGAGVRPRPGARGGRPPGRRDPRRPGGLRFPGLPRGQEPHVWFAERLLLTLSGQRPVHWMLGHADDRAYDRLVELAPRAPLRGGNRPVVDVCRASDPAPDVIEAYARIAYGEHRHRALAFRLERAQDGRWRCTAVDVGPG